MILRIPEKNNDFSYQILEKALTGYDDQKQGKESKSAKEPGKVSRTKKSRLAPDPHPAPEVRIIYNLIFASVCNNLDCLRVVSLSCLYRYLPTRLESILLYFLISRMKWLSGELKAEHVSRAGSTPHIC